MVGILIAVVVGPCMMLVTAGLTLVVVPNRHRDRIQTWLGA